MSAKVLGSGRFPSRHKPGTSWSAVVFEDGTAACTCPGFERYHHCRHVEALWPAKKTLKRKAKR